MVINEMGSIPKHETEETQPAKKTWVTPHVIHTTDAEETAKDVAAVEYQSGSGGNQRGPTS